MTVWRKHPHLHLLPTRGRRVRRAQQRRTAMPHQPCSYFVLDSSSKLGYGVLSPAPRGARSRGVVSCGSGARSWAGTRTPAPGGPGIRRAALDPAPGSGNGASGQGGTRRPAAPVRLKEPCARAAPALANTYSRAGRLSRHPSINPSGWSRKAPARRRSLFDIGFPPA